VLSVVRKASPDLYKFTGHQLRHVWNENFSKLMDSMDEPVTEERQEEMRSYLMGWKPGSGTAAIYNQRYVRRKGQEAALELQKNMIRLPKDLSNE
jgi:integrase